MHSFSPHAVAIATRSDLSQSDYMIRSSGSSVCARAGWRVNMDSLFNTNVVPMISITGGSCGKNPWIVNQKLISILDGTQMLTIDYHDSGFCRYVDGSRKGGLKDYNFDIRKHRNDACMLAIAEPGPDGNVREAVAPVKRGDVKRLKAVAAKMNVTVVTVSLPPFTFNSLTVEGVSFQTRFTTEANSLVAVPLDVRVLEYIRAAILESGKVDSPGKDHVARVDAPHGSFFSSSRSAFVAKTAVHGPDGVKTRWRVVKVHGKDEIERAKSMEDARAKIEEFLRGDGTDDSDHIDGDMAEECCQRLHFQPEGASEDGEPFNT